MKKPLSNFAAEAAPLKGAVLRKLYAYFHYWCRFPINRHFHRGFNCGKFAIITPSTPSNSRD
jgi:hypothetical protein